jgi:hypothetical protein
MEIIEILKENSVSRSKLSGKVWEYLETEIAQGLMAYYRYVYPQVTADTFVEKFISGGQQWGFLQFRNEEINEFTPQTVIDWCGGLFGDGDPLNPTLVVYEGEPVDNKVYLALVTIQGPKMDRQFTRDYRGEGTDTITFFTDFDDKDVPMIGLYQKGKGFTFLGDGYTINTASIADVNDYMLIDTQE